MKDIKTVGIVGLGALGTMYAALLTKALGKEHVRGRADSRHTARYRRGKIQKLTGMEDDATFAPMISLIISLSRILGEEGKE